jgi:CRISPR-associated protein Csm4
MNYWRLTLAPRSPLATPLQSDTLFGHLCWAIRYTEGEAALREFLEESEKRVFVLSDGFPGGFLPRPLCLPLTMAQQEAWVGRHFPQDEMQGYRKLKEVRKARFIPDEVFLSRRHQLSEEGLCDALLAAAGTQPTARDFRQAHNRIDRTTERTPDVGGLYFTEATAYDGKYRYAVYVATDFIESTTLGGLFRWMGNNGYGKDASIGRGQFELLDMADAGPLFGWGGNRRLSLSRGVITAEMREPLYRLFTKHGRLGGDRVNDTSGPFKYPIILTEPGATFASDDPFPGGLIRNVHPHLTDVVHMARHLTIPFAEVAT